MSCGDARNGMSNDKLLQVPAGQVSKQEALSWIHESLQVRGDMDSWVVIPAGFPMGLSASHPHR
jgi:hypothetical protein